MIKEIIVAIISGAIIAALGYVFIVKENQVKIEHLVEQSKELKQEIKEIKGSINSTNLFVTAAHPDGDLNLLQTTNKLQSLSIQEFNLLGTAIENGYFQITADNVLSDDAPEAIRVLNSKYNFDEIDVENFEKIINPIPTPKL